MCALLSACAPDEVVTTYPGTVGADAREDGEDRPGLGLIGVPLRVARTEGVVTREEFASDCAVSVHPVGDALVPAAGQTCVATVGRYGPWRSDGIVTITSERVSCEPVTLTWTERMPGRVTAALQCRRAWSSGGSAHRLDVVWFRPLAT